MGQVDKVGRGAKRRAETRGKLVRASEKLLITKGWEGVSIQSITEEADVGFGTFYYHFGSKADALIAVAEEHLAHYNGVLDSLLEGLDRPAEVISVSWRFTLAQALNKDGFEVMRQLPSGYLSERIAERAMTDVQSGIDAGDFEVDDIESLLLFIGGGMLSLMEAYSEGRIDTKAAEHTVVYFLCLLGVDKSEALELVSKPMPTID